MIHLFGSNIESFECLKSCALDVLRRQPRAGELFYYQWPVFHHTLVILRGK